MKNTLCVFAALFLLILGTGVVVVSNDLHELLQHSIGTMDQVRAAAVETRDTIAIVRQAADRDRQYYDAAAVEIPKTGRAIRKLVDYTNKSLNEPEVGTFALLDKSVMLTTISADHTLGAATDAIEKTGAAAEVSLQAFGHSADVLTERMNDEHLQAFMVNMDQASMHLDSTLDHIDQTAAYYQKKLTTPASFAKNVAGFVIKGAIDAANFLRAFF